MYVDLFCGIGGFSQASIENGKKIFLAIDNNPEVLKIYNRNITDVNTSCLDIPVEWNNIKTQIPRRSVIHASPPSKKILSWFLNEMMKGKWSWTLECDFHTDFLAVFQEVNLDFFIVKCCFHNVPHDSKKIIASNIFKRKPYSNSKLSLSQHWSKIGVKPLSDSFCLKNIKRSIESPCFEIKHSENIYWKTKNKEKFTLRDVFRLQTFSEDFDLSDCSFEMIKCATPVELGNLVISLINH